MSSPSADPVVVEKKRKSQGPVEGERDAKHQKSSLGPSPKAQALQRKLDSALEQIEAVCRKKVSPCCMTIKEADPESNYSADQPTWNFYVKKSSNNNPAPAGSKKVPKPEKLSYALKFARVTISHTSGAGKVIQNSSSSDSGYPHYELTTLLGAHPDQLKQCRFNPYERYPEDIQHVIERYHTRLAELVGQLKRTYAEAAADSTTVNFYLNAVNAAAKKERDPKRRQALEIPVDPKTGRFARNEDRQNFVERLVESGWDAEWETSNDAANGSNEFRHVPGTRFTGKFHEVWCNMKQDPEKIRARDELLQNLDRFYPGDKSNGDYYRFKKLLEMNQKYFSPLEIYDVQGRSKRVPFDNLQQPAVPKGSIVHLTFEPYLSLGKGGMNPELRLRFDKVVEIALKRRASNTRHQQDPDFENLVPPEEREDDDDDSAAAAGDEPTNDSAPPTDDALDPADMG